MIFGKEREAVRNATRAIRDLVLRRELGGGRPGRGPGRDGDDGGRAAAPAARARDAGSGHAARSRRADDRDPGRPPARPALAFAAQALAGSVRYGSTLRERYLNLLAAAMDGDTAARVHPAFLDGAAPADAGRGPHHQHVPARRPLPAGHRQRALPLRRAAVDRAAGTSACSARRPGCEYPERVALYIDNLCRLGLAELRAGAHRRRHAQLPRAGGAPEVKAAIARIEARIAGAGERSHAHADDGNRVVADVQRTALYVDRVRPPVLRGLRIPPRARGLDPPGAG